MKNNGFCFLLPFLLLICLIAAASQAAHAGAVDATVYVDTDRAVVAHYSGAGIQWDPADVPYTDAQWKRILQRVDVLKPQFIRCVLMGDYYCTGFDAAGNPVYDWDTDRMQRLYKILDYCQTHHIAVMLGEWAPPFGMASDDPRWSRLIGDCLAHLIRTRGDTCIQYYNKQNEPGGGTAAFAQWKASQISFAAELKKQGLDMQIKQVGPDVSGSGLFGWVDDTVRELPEAMGAYEVHWYAGDDEIQNGVLETTLRQKRESITAHDPNGAAKTFLVAEAGTADTLASQTGDWAGGDSNTKIRDFSYGVLMSDYLVQTMRAGLGGVSAWDLEDSMHVMSAKIAPTPLNPHAYNFKIWGFWNSLGREIGKPEDETLRPWFTPWALLCGSFPRGSQIVGASSTGLAGVRVAAAVLPALVPGSKRRDISLAVVNDSDLPRTIRIALPNAAGKATLMQFDYFDTDRPVDADGFPAAKRTLPGISLRTGLDVSLTSRGVVLLTTLNGGSPVALATGNRPLISAVTVHCREDATQVTRGETLQMQAETVPDTGDVRWEVCNLDGTPTDKAEINQAGLLTARKMGRVKVTAQALHGATPNIRAAIVLSVTASKTVTDTLNDWGKTFSHTGNWVFETIHSDIFEGDVSRLKRTADTPESVVYHVGGLTDFTARVFFVDDLAGKVTFDTSPDDWNWTPLPVKTDNAVPTGWKFSRVNLRPVQVPAGTNYVKITFAQDANVFSPQLGQMTLTNAPGGLPDSLGTAGVRP